MSKAYEMNIPSGLDLDTRNWARRVDYVRVKAEAEKLQKNSNVASSSRDKLKIAVMPIDCQLTFCHPDFELYVGGQSGQGALEDVRRLCEFIYRNMRVITRIAPTMDTHFAWQIFHPLFVVDQDGNTPTGQYPLQISAEDVRSGKWRVNPRATSGTRQDGAYAALEKYLLHYVNTLDSTGRFALTVWPFHAMLGGLGHALVPALHEAIFFHAVARGAYEDFQIKGGNHFTENYSVLGPEVLTNDRGRPIAQKNTQFIEALLEHDVIVIGGEAKSHCVAWTIDHLLREIAAQDPSLAKKVYLLEDCTSPVVVPGVVDFTDEANKAFERFEKAGMNVVRSTDPIASWPGISASMLGA